ncbi:MAG: hypothetical protein GY868_05655 [Deltaproteobacteria bacterium]|nr:hypothetical protein [Deltaproteobacteria bacterium]
MKKNMLFIIAIAGLLPLLAGCKGGMLTKTIPPSPTPNVKYIPQENPVVLSGIRNVAVFPFADYSHQQDQMPTDTWGGNIKIIEEITDHLIAHGLTVAIQEDVNTLLVDQNIIRPLDKDKYLIPGSYEEEDDTSSKVGTPEHEIANYEHSPDMQMEIMNIIKRNKKSAKPKVSNSPILQGATVGLTRDKVMELGQHLNVDLIIRGRIIDYGFKDIGTLNPLFRGVIPVAIDSVKDLFFGATGSYGYENDLEGLENVLVGAALGYAIGNNIVSTSTSQKSSLVGPLVTRRVSTGDRNHDDNAAEGAGVGALAGWMASQHPKKAKRAAVMQVRIYAQDAHNGNVLWSNRVEMEYTPKSNFAHQENHPRVMFERVIKEGVKALMDSFFDEARTVMADPDKTLYIQKEGT